MLNLTHYEIIEMNSNHFTWNRTIQLYEDWRDKYRPNIEIKPSKFESKEHHKTLLKCLESIFDDMLNLYIKSWKYDSMRTFVNDMIEVYQTIKTLKKGSEQQ